MPSARLIALQKHLVPGLRCVASRKRVAAQRLRAKRLGTPQPQPSVMAAPRFLLLQARTTQSRPSTSCFFALCGRVARAGLSRSEHSTEPSTEHLPTKRAEAKTGPV